MAAPKKRYSFAIGLALVASCKQQPLVSTPAASSHTSSSLVDTAEALRADVLLHDGLMPPFVVDNAISDCVEVTASVEAERIKLRFTVVKPIYKCGCPSAAVRYLIMKAGQPIVSDHFSAMKYTDRWFEAAQGLRLEDASQHSVAVGCNVQ